MFCVPEQEQDTGGGQNSDQKLQVNTASAGSRREHVPACRSGTRYLDTRAESLLLDECKLNQATDDSKQVMRKQT